MEQLQVRSPFPTIPADTELVGLVFELSSLNDGAIYPQYAIALHAWFLDQVRQTNPQLSAYLHDGESEKPFTISGLEGLLVTQGKNLQLQAGKTYFWYVTALSSSVATWLAEWLQRLPPEIALRNAPLQINKVAIAHSPTTYTQLFSLKSRPNICLSFLTPTSFRRKGHHFPLPVPTNIFHSYLRRWNDFSNLPFDQEEFLAWIDENVFIVRHHLESVKVAAGKKGSVTGFTGAVEFGLSRSARDTQFEQLFYALAQFAPYCGTGHKTTFGLGQTRWGWTEKKVGITTLETSLGQRIDQLTAMLMATQKRPGGDSASAAQRDRALNVCQTRATILARRELGESLQAIALDLEMPYQTVKTYVKLARQALQSSLR